MDRTKDIYIIIAKTSTGFGRVLRLFGKVRYNHASVALDEGLEEWYAFARKQHQTLLIAGLVQENIERYTLRRYSNVPVVIFKVPISQMNYAALRQWILTIQDDKEYMYNFLSVLSYPFTKGFYTYKAYSCIEFVMNVIANIGYDLSKPKCEYTPDDLLDLLAEYKIYQGNLLEYQAIGEQVKRMDEHYFRPMSARQVLQSVKNIGRVIKRFFSGPIIDG